MPTTGQFRLLPDDYADMRSRLRDLLQRWGLWTADEVDEVARFVEREMVDFCRDRKTSAK